MTCLGVLKRGERGKYNETGLKERRGIEMSTTVLHSRAAPSLKYSPWFIYTLTTLCAFAFECVLLGQSFLTYFFGFVKTIDVVD